MDDIKQNKILKGQRFGLLIVLEDGYYRITSKNTKIKQCKCKCDCGKEIMVDVYHLLDGHTKSCGCTRKNNFKALTTHNKSSSRIYIIYQQIKGRCYRPSQQQYNDYGGRGIKMGDEWADRHGFKNFYNWAINNGYSDDLTIDRIDTDKNYSPDNCRWVSRKAQNRNKRNNLYITYNGETHLLCEWCEILGISWGKIRYRYYHNKDLITGEKLNAENCYI